MKAYKLEIVCFDPNGDCDFDSMLYEIKNIKYFCKQIISAESTECGEWDDDHPLNKHSTSAEYIKTANWTPKPI
jgi:hypothetical protein